jgi:hypothetical protein
MRGSHLRATKSTCNHQKRYPRGMLFLLSCFPCLRINQKKITKAFIGIFVPSLPFLLHDNGSAGSCVELVLTIAHLCCPLFCIIMKLPVQVPHWTSRPFLGMVQIRSEDRSSLLQKNAMTFAFKTVVGRITASIACFFAVYYAVSSPPLHLFYDVAPHAGPATVYLPVRPLPQLHDTAMPSSCGLNR